MNNIDSTNAFSLKFEIKEKTEACVFINEDQASNVLTSLGPFMTDEMRGREKLIKIFAGLSDQSMSNTMPYKDASWLKIIPTKISLEDVIDTYLTCKIKKPFFIVSNNDLSAINKISRFSMEKIYVIKPSEIPIALIQHCEIFRQIEAVNQLYLRHQEKLNIFSEVLNSAAQEIFLEQLSSKQECNIYLDRLSLLPQSATRFIQTLAFEELGCTELFLEQVKKRLATEGKVPTSWIGNLHSSTNKKWINFISLPIVQTYLEGTLATSQRGFVLHSNKKRPHSLEENAEKMLIKEEKITRAQAAKR